MRFFTHETKAHQDPKIRKVIRTHGCVGYGIYWLLLEKLYLEDDLGFQVEANELWLEDFAESLHISDHRTLIRVFDTFAEVGLISKQLWCDHILYSDAIAERGDNYVQKKIYEREKKRKQRVSNQEKPSDVPNCPSGHHGDNSGHPENSVMSPSHIHIQYSNSQADPNTEEENTREENIYTPPVENFSEPCQPTKETLIAGMAEEKETPIPPPPLASLPPENVGLAIAPDRSKPKKSKNTLEADRIEFQPFLDVWLQDKVEDWVPHRTLSKTAISKLKTLCKEYGNALEIFQKGLWYAQTDSYHKRVLKGWTIEEFLGSGKPYQYYEKYEQAPKKGSAYGESIMSSDEIRKARIYAQLEQAMGVAS